MPRRRVLTLVVIAAALLFYFFKFLHVRLHVGGARALGVGGLGAPRTQPALNATWWGAPVVWSAGGGGAAVSRGDDDDDVVASVGLVAFAVGGYVEHLSHFLESAERFFMRGHAITYYVLTDNARAVPAFVPAPGRRLKALFVAERPEGRHLRRARMSLLAGVVQELVAGEERFVFCADVDLVFVDEVGPEVLGSLVATLHPGFFTKPRRLFPYERRPASAARVGRHEGDFYFTSELFGGRCRDVFALAQACAASIAHDSLSDLDARHLDESHLNKYLVLNKPTKVLSPEYCWPIGRERSSEMPMKRILSLRIDSPPTVSAIDID
ncbi:globoside alpha-1,3-N-acetylgalactosaminyltransferase 1-like isoform X2 [Petromyzon marinus]|uniref:globoside alpha-1,3-N-acetylgalactosaminyltransferase 1-like isoform X2 n=1 Tax=Petromyzon marinus TaxID=7757 RepID=UPI003F70ADE3